MEGADQASASSAKVGAERDLEAAGDARCLGGTIRHPPQATRVRSRNHPIYTDHQL